MLSSKCHFLALAYHMVSMKTFSIIAVMQARRLGGFGGFGRTPPTAWKSPLDGLLTDNLTGLNVSHV